MLYVLKFISILKFMGFLLLAYGGFLVVISHIVFMDAMDENGNEVMMNDKTQADGLLFFVVGALVTGAAILMQKMIHKYA